ncbi:MAG: hypothetical protein M3Z10_02955 [Gemmatimonadota bacterium]|nr:hypothetical protein [Gemmatimonadota bacterium]
MIDPGMMNDDMLSLSMFWAGALMVFAPLIGAAVVLGVWWRQRVRARGRQAGHHAPRTDDVVVSSPRPR